MKGHHWTLYILVCFICVGLLSGCNGQEATKDSEPGPHLLIATSGEVSLKREAWKDYQPTSQGINIQRGDLIRPAPGQTVTILCADLSLHTLDREGGSPCKVDRYILRHVTIPHSPPRGTNKKIPYIRYPRHTTALDTRPLLSWHDTGASSVTVAIKRDGETIWQQPGVQGTQLRYPDDKDPLRSGVDYLLFVTDEDSDRRSSEEQTKGLGFQVLSEEAREEVEAQRDKILNLTLDESARHLALATYYAGQELWGEALAELEQISPRSPVIERRLGDLLLAVKLSDEAKNAYQNALDNATTLGDLETQAVAHVQLSQLRTNREEHRKAAINLYEQLGDQTMAEALGQEPP